MANVLICGVNGFVGRHLTKELTARGVSVHGIGREEVPLTSKLSSYQSADLSDPKNVSNLQLINYDSIINLAGLANVGASFANPEMYIDLNVRVHTTLYDALIENNIRSRIIAVSSGAVYDPFSPMPLGESSPLAEEQATNPYSISKQRMEKALLNYSGSGLECIVVRPFNHTGPGQLPGFLVPDLSAQIKKFVKSGETIQVGNLNTKRDYTDVRDIVKAYADLALAPKDTIKNSLYNICSGRSRSGEEILRNLLTAFEINENDVSIQVDKSKIRPNEIKDIFGDYSRINEDVGWSPTYDLETTMRDFAKWESSREV